MIEVMSIMRIRVLGLMLWEYLRWWIRSYCEGNSAIQFQDYCDTKGDIHADGGVSGHSIADDINADAEGQLRDLGYYYWFSGNGQNELQEYGEELQTLMLIVAVQMQIASDPDVRHGWLDLELQLRIVSVAKTFKLLVSVQGMWWTGIRIDLVLYSGRRRTKARFIFIVMVGGIGDISAEVLDGMLVTKVEDFRKVYCKEIYAEVMVKEQN
ncbi:hypothetical protein MUG91_G2320n1 [Manis pentadactyla]|nr:hypothetical protein MUG91_G2320n1 [Manis pentadactyla]